MFKSPVRPVIPCELLVHILVLRAAACFQLGLASWKKEWQKNTCAVNEEYCRKWMWYDAVGLGTSGLYFVEEISDDYESFPHRTLENSCYAGRPIIPPELVDHILTLRATACFQLALIGWKKEWQKNIDLVNGEYRRIWSDWKGAFAKPVYHGRKRMICTHKFTDWSCWTSIMRDSV